MNTKNITSVIDRLLSLSGKEHRIKMVYSDRFIDRYEKKIGIKIQSDYRELLKRASHVFYGTIELLDMTESGDSRSELSTVIIEARRLGVPHNWFPICEDNGDYYCLLPDGTVRYWSHDGDTEEMWENLSEWVYEVWIGGN